jgi:hypothetical protein
VFDDFATLFFTMFDNPSIDVVASTSGFVVCAEAGSLALARKAHHRFTAREIPLDIIMWNALIYMYARCSGDSTRCRRQRVASQSRTR